MAKGSVGQRVCFAAGTRVIALERVFYKSQEEAQKHIGDSWQTATCAGVILKSKQTRRGRLRVRFDDGTTFWTETKHLKLRGDGDGAAA